MRKLIVSEFVSLDGVTEAPGGEPGYAHSGWVVDFLHPAQEEYKLNEVLESDALLLGRVTYEGFAEAWPPRSGEFADKMNSMPKYVVSSTLEERDLTWANSTRIDGHVAAQIAKLKDEDGGPILVAGSQTLVHFLLENDLVDELRLMVFPVILGSGKRWYPERPDKTVMRPTDTRSFGSGAQVLVFEPAGSS